MRSQCRELFPAQAASVIFLQILIPPAAGLHRMKTSSQDGQGSSSTIATACSMIFWNASISTPFLLSSISILSMMSL